MHKLKVIIIIYVIDYYWLFLVIFNIILYYIHNVIFNFYKFVLGNSILKLNIKGLETCS